MKGNIASHPYQTLILLLIRVVILGKMEMNDGDCSILNQTRAVTLSAHVTLFHNTFPVTTALIPKPSHTHPELCMS